MNTFGHNFRLTSFGESHSQAIGGIVDGCPPGVAVDYDLLLSEMARRHLGADATTRQEPDDVELLSGILNGVTLGTPIAFIIRNKEQRSTDYNDLTDCYRPGHADFTWQQRYGLRDFRGGGRASARETAVRVAAGALAKMVLRQRLINVEASVLYNPTPAENDSSGGIIQCTVRGLPAGVGNPIFGKLNAALAAAIMSIPSATGFEMGEGFSAAHMKGSEWADQWRSDGSLGTVTNHCGGIQGGISNGMPILFRAAFHPVATLPIPTPCLTPLGTTKTITPHGRHDRNHIPRTVVVVEAMTALVIADLLGTS